MKSLNNIIEQLNERLDPAKDHERIDFQGLLHNEESFNHPFSKEWIKVYKNRLNFLATSLIIKPILRGGVIGLGVGTLAGYALGDNTFYSPGLGFLFGYTADTFQYNVRGAYHLINASEKQLKEKKKEN